MQRAANSASDISRKKIIGGYPGFLSMDLYKVISVFILNVNIIKLTTTTAGYWRRIGVNLFFIMML